MLLIIFFRLLIVFTTIGLVFRAMDLGGVFLEGNIGVDVGWET